MVRRAAHDQREGDVCVFAQAPEMGGKSEMKNQKPKTTNEKPPDDWSHLSFIVSGFSFFISDYFGSNRFVTLSPTFRSPSLVPPKGSATDCLAFTSTTVNRPRYL